MEGLSQSYAAMFAQVKSLTLIDRMQITALLTLLGPARGQTLILANGQNDAVNQVARAFMVDDGPRPKLRDGQETWAREVFITLFGAPPRNIGLER